MKNLLHTPSHAQFRFYRRLANKRFGNDPGLNPSFGQPIPGELSAVELAHKQRRAMKRPVNLKARRKNLEVELMVKVREHQKLKEGEKAKEAGLTREIRELQGQINRIVKSLDLLGAA